MDLFRNRLSKEKYAYINKFWSKLEPNIAWLMGDVSLLIRQDVFSSKAEWKTYYFSSGEERRKKMSKLRASQYGKLLELTPSDNEKLNRANFEYGRTEQEVKQLGKKLYRCVLESGNPENLNENECMYAVYFKIVCEAWNNFISEKKNAKTKLLEFFNKQNLQVNIIDVPVSFYSQYAVDYEVYWNGHIICGLRISGAGRGYKSDTDKNNSYTKEYRRLVFGVFFNAEGELEDGNIISLIIEEIDCVGKLGLGYKK